MENFNRPNQPLDLRTPEGEAEKQRVAAEKAAALQQQAANSRAIQAQGIDGMRPKGFNDVPGTNPNAGTPGLFTLPKDQLEHPSQSNQEVDVVQTPQNPQEVNQAENPPQEKPQKGLFGKLFGK